MVTQANGGLRRAERAQLGPADAVAQRQALAAPHQTADEFSGNLLKWYAEFVSILEAALTRSWTSIQCIDDSI